MKHVLLALMIGASLFSSRALAADRPNIIFILIDDQRFDALGCAGHPFLKTPNIDRIAREGAYFENAFVTTPLCSPSRASFLTGQYVHTHGVRGNGDSNALSHQLVTWPALLQKSGYETAWIGKIHMGNDAGPRPGFDHWISFKGQGEFIDPTFNIDGKVEKQTGYMTDLLSARAVDFLQRKREKPFVLCLSHKAVHGPFTPADRHKDLYTDEELPKPPSLDDSLEGKPMLQNRSQPQTRPRAQRPGRGGGGGAGNVQRNQLRCIASIDEGVGAMLKALEESKQLDNTIIVYTSDNGYFWGEHKLGDKRAAYEESIRVPLVMRYPKLIPASTRLNQIALNIDLAPTFLQLAGATIPDNMHGKSLVSLFDGDRSKWRTAALLEYFMEPQFGHVLDWQAVRNDRWKYVHYPKKPEYDELYDLQADKYEMKNLISDANAAETLKSMKSELQRQLDATR
jgi:N-acetylglucosamine-6-sulfatase